MTDLLPAAQAIRAAIAHCVEDHPDPSDGSDLAAAVLRAVADQEGIKPEPVGPMLDVSPRQVAIALAVKRSQVRARRAILAIAAELEGQQ